jgi:hypothetical protein
MKIRYSLYIALVVAVISLMFPKLALAAEECTHDQATIGALHACVVHAADEGHINNPGVAKSLLAKLDAAQSALDRCQSDVAVHNLQAFQHEVKSQSGKHIVAEHAEHLLMHAQHIIEAIMQ